MTEQEISERNEELKIKSNKIEKDQIIEIKTTGRIRGKLSGIKERLK